MRAQHGVGHGVEPNRQVQIGAVLTSQYRQAFDPRSSAAPAIPRRCHPPTHRLSDRGRSQPLLIRQFQFSPSSRGFSPPSTTQRWASACACYAERLSDAHTRSVDIAWSLRNSARASSPRKESSEAAIRLLEVIGKGGRCRNAAVNGWPLPSARMLTSIGIGGMAFRPLNPGTKCG